MYVIIDISYFFLIVAPEVTLGLFCLWEYCIFNMISSILDVVMCLLERSVSIS